ncbi:Glycine Rich Secreted Protein [Caenorhabditis elegans]|uniref:Glycine Rich Secreted Protein n=2 Tax=Caenorhabditis elegans TaxID=6239 RepID=O62437_CAEEL|nr:Glycine Rich Secreted Protein [Caenorhabditis elegans]CAB09004.1 Glycine Rich Secreted Protein [Caenorhabditis elegans]|eukprot:NP_502815.1 Uncharacterized protein CELE_Y41E3.8 [Caenorhabditis elegans]
MVYIDKDGNVLEKKQKGIVEMIVGFFTFIMLFFRSLLGFTSPTNRNSNSQDYRNIVRGGGVNGAGGGGNAYRRNGGGGGGGGRNIGGLPTSSGVAPPPMGGGCCGGGGCG